VLLFILGIGMDSSVTPLRHGGLSLVQTTDFFYPLVDDPYMMGKIILRPEIFIFQITLKGRMNIPTHHCDGSWQNVGRCTDIVQNMLEKF
jgi:hypothetical protein